MPLHPPKQPQKPFWISLTVIASVWFVFIFIGELLRLCVVLAEGDKTNTNQPASDTETPSNQDGTAVTSNPEKGKSWTRLPGAERQGQ